MTASEITALLALCTAMSFSPGPNTTLSTALAANLGLRRALGFCLAVPVGWLALMLACGLGLGALVNGVPALRWGVKLAGVAYLLWLARRLLLQTSMAQVDAARLQVGFVQGVLLQFVNIKAWLLALTLTAGWVLGGPGGTDEGHQRLALATSLMMAFAFASNFTYALAGALLRQWLGQGRRLQWFNRTLAAVLAITSAWMLSA